MSDRDRLVELLKKGQAEYSERSVAEIKKLLYEKHKYNSKTDKVGNLWDFLTDHLLSNGVIVPPCKVGETLYFLYDRTYANIPDLTPLIYKTNDWYFDIDQKGISILPRNIHSYRGKHHYCLGETVFITREEAEQALRERKK